MNEILGYLGLGRMLRPCRNWQLLRYNYRR